MKVIKEGEGIDPIIGQFECTGVGNGLGGCGATLEINLSDLRRYQGTDMYGDANPEQYSFRCIRCETLTDIPSNDHPKGKMRDRVIPFTSQWKNEGVDNWESIAWRTADLRRMSDEERKGWIESVLEELPPDNESMATFERAVRLADKDR